MYKIINPRHFITELFAKGKEVDTAQVETLFFKHLKSPSEVRAFSGRQSSPKIPKS